MKQIVFFILWFAFFSCNHKSDSIVELQNRIDRLENKHPDTYIPGFGELMSHVQSHHAKLWFAGSNENWKLAKFEVKELKEISADILKYQKDRKESHLIKMIYPALDSVDLAIDQREVGLFKSNYTKLTNACNTCHINTKFKYITIRVPKKNSFENQRFNVTK